MNVKNVVVTLLLLIVSGMQQAVALDVVFRCDDLTLRGDSVSDRIVSLFIAYDVPLSVAVVPCDSHEQPFELGDVAYVQKLKNPLVEVCMHGYTHENFGGGEFCCLSRTEAQRRIYRGKLLLQSFLSQSVETFVPPFNAINYHLPTLLRETGFMSLSSDMFDGVGDDAVAYYPETLGRLASEEGIWHAAEQSIRRSAKSSALCVVMFHAYDLCDEASWQQLAALLNYCKKNANIRLHTFESLRAANVDGSCTRYEANKLEHLLQRYLLPHGVLHPTWVCYAALAGSVVCYWALLLLAVQLAYAILSARWQRIILLLLAIVGGVGLALAVVFHAVGPLKLLALDALVSLLLVAGASVAQAIYQ